MRLDDLVGIPFRDGGRDTNGCDCWGLCMLYYKEILGIDINDFKGSAFASGKVFDEYKAQIEKNWIEIEEPELHAIVAMDNLGCGSPTHFGIYIGYGKVLHVLRGTRSIADKNAPSIKGYYKWQP